MSCLKQVKFEMVTNEDSGLGAPSTSKSKLKCKGCQQLVLGHFGPTGSEKCIFSVVESLKARMTAAEEALKAGETRRVEEMEMIQSAYQKEVEALLSNIAVLEERITVLCSQNQSKSGEKEDGENGMVQSSCPKAKTTPLADVEEPADSPPAPALDEERSVSPRHGGADECVIRNQEGSEKCEKKVNLQEEKEDQETWSQRARRFRPAQESHRRMYVDRTANIRAYEEHRGPSKGLRASARLGNADRLRGATRSEIKPFHLWGISIDLTADDVIDYCHRRNITVTGCFILRPQVWHGTRTAKLFTSSDFEKRLLAPHSGLNICFVECESQTLHQRERHVSYHWTRAGNQSNAKCTKVYLALPSQCPLYLRSISSSGP